MATKQAGRYFNHAALLDLHHWEVWQGCLFLTTYKRDFSPQEFEFLKKELSKHDRKTLESAFSFMESAAQEFDDNTVANSGAFLEFMHIYRIAATAFDINNAITPYQFISWAISKCTITVHEDLIAWREDARAKSPAGRSSLMRKRLEEAQKQIEELEQELASCREQLAEVRMLADTSGKEDTSGFFEAYPICKLICDLHLAGKKQAEIRAELTARGYTKAQSGFITQEDTIPRTDDTIKQSVKRSKRSLEG